MKGRRPPLGEHATNPRLVHEQRQRAARLAREDRQRKPKKESRMIVLVCGDRNYTDEAKVHEVLDTLDRANGVGAVVEGCASGADRFGETWAQSRDVMIYHHPPHWRHTDSCEPECLKPVGKRAGMIRNGEMLRDAPDLVLAFHNNIAESRGTADMIRQARRAGVAVWLHHAGGIDRT